MTKILSLDGGGVFGIGQATILNKMINLDKFDVIAGTSIGSVVGAIVASGDPSIQSKIVDFFQTWMPKIFSGHCWRQYLPITPKYNDTNLNDALKYIFPPDYKFKQLKRPMFITAADLESRKLKVFYSGDAIDGELPLWDILRSAVAAETYFIPHNGLSDGGVFANNPSMVAVAGAMAKLNINPSDMKLCSIGTGIPKWTKPVGTTNNWSMLSWGIYLLTAALNGSASSMHEYFVQQMGLKKYLRIQFIRKNSWNMDDADCMNEALVAWDNDITNAVYKVDMF